MRKVILCIAMLAVLVVPLTAEAHGRFVVQGPFFWLRLCLPGSVRKLREDGAVHLRLSRAVRLRHVDLFPPSLPRETGRVLDL